MSEKNLKSFEQWKIQELIFEKNIKIALKEFNFYEIKIICDGKLKERTAFFFWVSFIKNGEQDQRVS